ELIYLLRLPVMDCACSRSPQEQWAACKRPGTKSSELSIFGQGWTCVLFFCMFFLLGFLVEETPCEHGENMQTPHRKAQEIAHLSTEGLGDSPPEQRTPGENLTLSRRRHHTHARCA